MEHFGEVFLAFSAGNQKLQPFVFSERERETDLNADKAKVTPSVTSSIMWEKGDAYARDKETLTVQVL